jgi:hypothetical protein
MSIGGSGAAASPFPGDDRDELTQVHPERPPVAILAAAAALTAVAALLWLPEMLTAHTAGYVISSFGTLGVLAAFKRVDLKRRQSPFYSPNPTLRRVELAIAVAAVALAVSHVWVIATFLAAQ